jgi:hypothetical protein
MNNPLIGYRPMEGATPEGELNALAAIYHFCLFSSQARKGEQHDLTNDSTAEMVKNGPQKTEQEKT